MVIGAKPWLADTEHPLYEAGKAAVKRGSTLHITLSTNHNVRGLYTGAYCSRSKAAVALHDKNIQAVVMMKGS